MQVVRGAAVIVGRIIITSLDRAHEAARRLLNR